MEKITYNVREVAELLGISKSYAYRLINEGVLPVLMVGKRKVIPKKSLEVWLRKNVDLAVE